MISVKLNVDDAEIKVLERYIKKLPAATRRALYKIILSAAIETQGDIKETIIRGPTRTGRNYRLKGGKTHRASAPGEPPKSNTGQLANSILFKEYTGRQLKVVLGSTVLHGLYTEEGTTKSVGPMKPRPWLKPAVEAARPGLIKRLVKETRGVI